MDGVIIEGKVWWRFVWHLKRACRQNPVFKATLPEALEGRNGNSCSQRVALS